MIHNTLKHFFKPRLSDRTARQIAKNLMLMLDIQALIERPESKEADEIRAKYWREKQNKKENEQANQN